MPPSASSQLRALRDAPRPTQKRDRAPVSSPPSTLEEAFLLVAHALHLLATKEPVAPVVNISPPQVTVQPPNVKVDAPVSVNIPQVSMPPVTVKVDAPRQAPPNVVVNPVLSAPNVTVNTPAVQDIRIVSAPPVNAEIERDRMGRAVSIKQER